MRRFRYRPQSHRPTQSERKPIFHTNHSHIHCAPSAVDNSHTILLMLPPALTRLRSCGVFRSPPNLKVGCYHFHSSLLPALKVSILTQPEGWVLPNYSGRL